MVEIHMCIFYMCQAVQDPVLIKMVSIVCLMGGHNVKIESQMPSEQNMMT